MRRGKLLVAGVVAQGRQILVGPDVLLDPIVVLDGQPEVRDRVVRAPEARLHARDVEVDERLRPLGDQRLERRERALEVRRER